MAEEKKSSTLPFYSWMPKPLGILVFLQLYMSPVFSGGMNLYISPELVGDMGWMSEDVQMAFFSTAVGICVFPPIMLKYLTTHRLKQTLLWGLTLMILGNICVITTKWVPALCLVCMMMGCLRVMMLVSLTFAVGPYLMNVDVINMFTVEPPPMTSEEKIEASHGKGILMLLLYIIILVYAYLSNWLYAWVAYHYQWRMSFVMVIGILLISLVLVLATMETEPVKPDNKIDWFIVLDTALMIGILVPMTFMLLYGKTLDWFDSKYITLACGIMLICLGLFVSRMTRSEFFNVGIFSYRNPLFAMLLFMMAMVCNTPASLIQSYALITTNIDNEQWAALFLWAIVGLVCGLLIALLLGRFRTHYRYVFALGFLLMCACHVYMYFQYQTDGLYENLRLPMVLSYGGLMLLYPLVASYGMNHLPVKHFVGFVFVMILMRNTFAPILGVSLLSNGMQERQQYYNMRLAENVDAQNPNMQAIGGVTPATTVLTYASKAKQSGILAMRDISGITIYVTAGMALIALLFPYRKEDRV